MRQHAVAYDGLYRGSKNPKVAHVCVRSFQGVAGQFLWVVLVMHCRRGNCIWQLRVDATATGSGRHRTLLASQSDFESAPDSSGTS